MVKTITGKNYSHTYDRAASGDANWALNIGCECVGTIETMKKQIGYSCDRNKTIYENQIVSSLKSQRSNKTYKNDGKS